MILADDNPEVLEMLADMLQPSCFVAAAFTDGHSMLQQVLELDPDVIILDISLPDMTGFDIIKQLKRTGSRAKVILLTVHENIDFVRAAFELDAAGYVYKSRMNSDVIAALNAISSGERFSSAEMCSSSDVARQTPATGNF